MRDNEGERRLQIAKEATIMEKLEKVELIREKCGVSYEDAKAALDACGDDTLDAIIWLEKQGKPPSRRQIIRPKLRLSQAFHLKWRQRKRHIKSQARNPISLSIWTHYGTIARSCSTKELRQSSLSCAMTNSL